MDHRAVLDRIPSETLVELNARSDRRGLIHLAGHLAVILVCATWIALGWPLWWAVLPFYGVALVFLFCLEHETTHRTPFATAWLNDWVGRACGLVLLLPFEWFRCFHLAHHKFTNIPGKDPELEGGHPTDWSAYLVHVSGALYWRGMIRQIWKNALGHVAEDYIPPRAVPKVKREARLMLVLYGFVLLSLFWSPLLFWIWPFPLLLGQPFLRLYLLAEHGRCAFVANMLENTRTIYTNRLVRFLAWNMPYHTEHHSAPTVPFHRLPDLHRIMRPSLGVTAPSYAAFTAEYAGDLERRAGRTASTFD